MDRWEGRILDDKEPEDGNCEGSSKMERILGNDKLGNRGRMDTDGAG